MSGHRELAERFIASLEAREWDVWAGLLNPAVVYEIPQMLLAIGAERDPWMDRMLSCPATVVSSTLQGPFDWPDATVANGDAAEIVRRMKE